MSFASDPAGSLGASLNNHDVGSQSELYVPAYASIKALLEGETVARKSGVAASDCIVAVNGEEFRRFPPTFEESDVQHLTVLMDGTTLSENTSTSNTNSNSTQPPKSYNIGEGYAATLTKIKTIKSKKDPSNPLVLTLERYGWNSRANAWHRFLTARDGDTLEATKMMKDNEEWRQTAFPIDLKREGLQKILKSRAISEIDIQHEGIPPTVYVDYSKLQSLEDGVSTQDVVDAFVLFTETLLSRSSDPRHPRTCQFIDLSKATRSISSGLRVTVLRQIYAVFEPNYPETLEKMIMYPVSRLVRRTTSMLLSFVNKKTREKFIITDDLDVVCTELGWNKTEVEACGGVTQYMHQHEKKTDGFIL